MEAVDLKRLLEDAEGNQLSRRWARRPHRPASRGNLHLQGARDLLHSAFENVLRNALRYTDEDTTVTVVAMLSLVRILREPSSDEGPGIPEQDLVHVFEPFYRVAKARDRQSGGTGLGLAIGQDRTFAWRIGRGVQPPQGRPLGICREVSGIPNSRRRTAAGIECGSAGVSRTIRRLGLSLKSYAEAPGKAAFGATHQEEEYDTSVAWGGCDSGDRFYRECSDGSGQAADGCRHQPGRISGLTLQDPKLPVPTLRRLAETGCTAKRMIPINPTVTWPNHTAMVTGVQYAATRPPL